MEPFKKLSLPLALLALAVTLPAAQAQQWNRRISDVRIVHPPGTPPGTWRVDATLEVQAQDSTPQPVVLDCEVTLSLNGTPIDTYHAGAGLSSPSCSAGPCGAQCGPWSNMPPYPPYPGICTPWVLATGQVVCGCLGRIYVTYGPYGNSQSTDLITVGVTPTPSSLPETDTSDDSFSLHVSENNPGTVFCTGDGALATGCPCGNTGAQGHGCANSVNPQGALLEATGFTQPDPGTTNDSVVLHGSGMPATSSTVYLKSTGSNPNGAVFGDGLRCVTGSLIRLRTKINVGGASRFPEPGEPSLSAAGGTPPGSGVTAWYQVYYRNAGAYCTTGTFNMTNGVSVVW
jgi:hypothetical protein